MQSLLDQTIDIINNDETAKMRIEMVDRKLLEENIKQTSFF